MRISVGLKSVSAASSVKTGRDLTKQQVEPAEISAVLACLMNKPADMVEAFFIMIGQGQPVDIALSGKRRHMPNTSGGFKDLVFGEQFHLKGLPDLEEIHFIDYHPDAADA